MQKQSSGSALLKKVFLKILPEASNSVKKEVLAQVISYELCKSFKNTFFIEHLRWLLLQMLGRVLNTSPQPPFTFSLTIKAPEWMMMVNCYCRMFELRTAGSCISRKHHHQKASPSWLPTRRGGNRSWNAEIAICSPTTTALCYMILLSNVVLVSFLLNLKRFHILLWGFYWWLCTSKSQLVWIILFVPS